MIYKIFNNTNKNRSKSRGTKSNTAKHVTLTEEDNKYERIVIQKLRNIEISKRQIKNSLVLKS